ncbi:MAG: DPP IV N-terminal domain-containing protein [Ahniella sp.]|nr:DPP IV N-terminal domain-containing protein [Ahniella sp.]
MHRFLLAGLMTMSMACSAADLPIERLFEPPALAGKTPQGLKVAPDGSRVTFLRGKETDQFQLDLWQYHIESGKTELLVDSALLNPDGEKLSAEEQARRERARTASLKGILEYSFSPDGKKLVFPLNGEVFLYDLELTGPEALRKLTSAALGFVTDARVSPAGKFLSFVREQDLWLIELETARSIQLTFDGEGLISNATAEFIAQEEMARFEGYWWAPDDSAIAFARVDESPVPVQRRFEINADNVQVIEQRYPAAGETNASVKLGVIDLAQVRPAGLVSDASGTTIANADVKIDWVTDGRDDAYLARVEWPKHAGFLTYQWQSRDQRRLELRQYQRDARTTRVLLVEESKSFVNLNDDLHFLADGDFLWTSERDGFARVYRFDGEGRLRYALSPEAWVVDRIAAVDEQAERLYFVSGGPDPLQAHVFGVPMNEAVKSAEMVSAGEGIHNAVFAKDGSVFVDTFSAAEAPPSVRLFRNTGEHLAVLEANALGSDHPYDPYIADHARSEFGSISNEAGDTFHYRLIKPSGFDPNRRYPAIVNVYGGPHKQMVQKAWGDLHWQVLARQGYVVFVLDNRGTPRRGKAFEEALFRRMGGPEVEDQMTGIRWLKQQPFVDPARVGVYGWSYGGYMSLMMLAKHSDEIAAGVSGAPVTDWALYDTHYTERYMDHPAANAEGYTDSAVFAHVDGLTAPLLLVHGMADDNVLFTNSTKLMTALQERGQGFELMTYPGAKHGISSPYMKKHYGNALLTFFARHLRPDLVVEATPAPISEEPDHAGHP